MIKVTSKSTVLSKVTRRSLVIGLVMAAWVNFWPVYASLVLHSTRADHAHLSVALLIPYLFCWWAICFWDGAVCRHLSCWSCVA